MLPIVSASLVLFSVMWLVGHLPETTFSSECLLFISFISFQNVPIGTSKLVAYIMVIFLKMSVISRDKIM